MKIIEEKSDTDGAVLKRTLVIPGIDPDDLTFTFYRWVNPDVCIGGTMVDLTNSEVDQIIDFLQNGRIV